MPWSERLCCTWPGVRSVEMVSQSFNSPRATWEMQGTTSPRSKLPCHLTSRDQRSTVNYPAPPQGHQSLAARSLVCHWWKRISLVQIRWNIFDSWRKKFVATVCLPEWPICGLCLWLSICPGVPAVSVKSVTGSEWKTTAAPMPLASSPTSHLSPAVSSASSGS